VVVAWWRASVEQGFDDSVVREEWSDNEGSKALVEAPFSLAVGHTVVGDRSKSFTMCWSARHSVSFMKRKRGR
jgi:hypothetical protein